MTAPLIAERPPQAMLAALPILGASNSASQGASPADANLSEQPRTHAAPPTTAQVASLRRPAAVTQVSPPPAPATGSDGNVAPGKILFSPRDEQITTLIAASQRLKGTLEGSEGVIVKGAVDGDILVDDSGDPETGTVVVCEGAVVNGTISGRRVIVFGTVNGPIISRTSLTIAETGTVVGDVYYNRMINSDGGTIEGHLRRIKDGVDPLAALQALNARGPCS